MKDTGSLATARLRRTALAWTAVSVLALLASGGSLLAYASRMRAGHGRALRVCADPNNLPFSNQAGQGFENRIAEVLADELGARVEYTWWAQRRGFVRNTLGAGRCDVIMGVPAGLERVLATRPYYRSSYAFVYRRDRGLHVRSFDDPALRALRIGVPVVGDDYAGTPPAHALARRGLVANVIGYSVYGDYAQADPPARLIEAVARGDVDLAVAWGPLAGYFARRQAVPLEVVPVSPPADGPAVPFVYDMALGVRRSDAALKEELEHALARRRAEVDRILASYGVPRVALESAGAGS